MGETNNTITRMSLPGTGTLYLDLASDIRERLYSEFMDRLSEIPIISHKCNSCGGTVEMDADRHIFVCPYCGTCYAVGTKMINDKGGTR